MNKEEIRAHVDEILKGEDVVNELTYLIEEIIDPGVYCERCGACGEPPCCDYHMCDKIQCKYGDGYIRSYEEDSKEIQRLIDLNEGLDWKDELPFDSFGTYLWVVLDPDNDDLEAGGVCTVEESWDDGTERLRKETWGDYVYFYTLDEMRFGMYFRGSLPIIHNGEPFFSKIARIQLPPQPRLY